MTEKYDFSTSQKRADFIKSLTSGPSNDWSRRLPNLKWLTAEEFAASHFFMYGPGTFFHQTFGGPNKSDNHEQCPVGFRHTQAHYAMAFINSDMTGYLMLAEHHEKKLAFASFAFCKHENCTGRNLGRCYNEYTCQDCGYVHTVDSSD